MSNLFCTYRRSLVTSTAAIALLLATTTPALAFNPDDDTATTAAAAPLPDTAAITGRISYNDMRQQSAPTGYAPPVTQVQMPSKPLYPQLNDGVAAPVPAPVEVPLVPVATTAVPVPTAVEKPILVPTMAPAPAKPAAAVLAVPAPIVLEAPKTAAAPIASPLAAPVVVRSATPVAVVPAAPVLVKAPVVVAPAVAQASPQPAPAPVAVKMPVAPAPVIAKAPVLPATVVKAPVAPAPVVVHAPVAAKPVIAAPESLGGPAPLTIYSAATMNQKVASQPAVPVQAVPVSAQASTQQPPALAEAVPAAAEQTRIAPPVITPPAMPTRVTALTPQPQPELSDESRTILSGVPTALDAPQKQPSQHIGMNRVSPEIKNILGTDAGVKEESFEAVGLSITVRRPGLDTNYELNRAYEALMGGDTDTAITTYKNILSVEPRNEDALFGLAATYHRLGNVQQARPFYGMLLKVNPNHREGLNNFLVLVSDESPADALPELERLEARNPDFSPIPAQIGIVLDKMGYADAAQERMLRAIELAPDNLSYKYNLAVMLDRQEKYSDAAALYRLLVKAALSGATVPAPVETMQKRLNYIVTEMNTARTAGR